MDIMISINRMFLVGCILIWVVCNPVPVSAKILYVDATYGNDSFDGISWITAKQTLNGALAVADIDDTINVAEGTYREIITLMEGISLYGGYPHGGGPRNIRLHETIIDGDKTGTVITGARNNVVDGFTITGGSGTPPPMWPGVTRGGGMIVLPDSTVSNNVFTGNHMPMVVSEFTRGAALYIQDTGDALVVNNFFYGNSTGWGGDGAAIYITDTDPIIVNNTFVNNTYTGAHLSVVSIYHSSPVIFNNIFFDNDGTAIREIEPSKPGPSVSSNDFYLNESVYYDYETGETFTDVTRMDTTLPETNENIDCDPALVGSSDFHLTQTSCCIDRGTEPGSPAHDLDLDPRPLGSGYDIGADEFKSSEIPCITHTMSTVLLLFQTGFITGMLIGKRRL